MTVEPVTDPCCHHGEGPVWDARRQVLRWVDMTSGDILSYKPGQVSRQRVSDQVPAFRNRDGGGLVVASERGFTLVDEDGAVRPLPDLWDDPTLRMNDGACDPQGRFYCGSMAYDEEPGRGSMYRLDPDLSVTEVMTGLTISNGLAWSPDGAAAYYVDTATGRLDVWDFDAAEGTFDNLRAVVHLDPVDGFPDGIAVDDQGNIWVATWTGRSVRCYSPGGRLLEQVRFPAARVTACAFGGRDLDTLYVTTSRLHLRAGEPDPLGGSLFAITGLGVTGLPVHGFAG